MACVDCTEFLVQGSGTVGAGSAFSYEKVVIAEDPDNIPLVLLSVKALDKDDVLLVDQTPAWLEATTSGVSVLVGGKLVYRLTVTVEIDAVRVLDPEPGDPTEWGEGTYTIELRAQVEDASKPVIVCLFDVCITGTPPDVDRQVVWVNVSGAIFAAPIANVEAGKTEIRVTDSHNIRGVGFHRAEDKIYFITLNVSDNYIIKKMNTDGSSEELVADTGITEAGGSPMDTDSGSLIVLESEGLLIFAAKDDIYKANLDGSSVTLIHANQGVQDFFFPGPLKKFYRNAFANPRIEQFDADVLTGPEATNNSNERHGVYVPEFNGGKVIIVKIDLTVHAYEDDFTVQDDLGFSVAVNPEGDIGYRVGENAFYYLNGATFKLVKFDLLTGAETNVSDWSTVFPHERGGPIFVT